MKNIAWLLPVLMLLVMVSCKKDSKKGDINQTNFSADVVIDGDTVKMQQGLLGYSNGVGSGGGEVDTFHTYLFRQLAQFYSPTDTLRIYFIDTFAVEPSLAVKEAIVHTGSYPTGYGTFDIIAPDANLKPGAAIVYVDAQGVRWTTDRDPQVQPNWNFNVSAHTANSIDAFSKFLTDITFTARLHNPVTGASIDVQAIKMRTRTIAQ
ncbi:hypothetical protein BH09BAC1_BH09BAC1_06400 [soil metagenome]